MVGVGGGEGGVGEIEVDNIIIIHYSLLYSHFFPSA